MNGSEVGGWDNMDYNEGEDEEWGECRRRMSDKRTKGNKRVRNEKDNGIESDEERQVMVQKEREEKYVVIIRFNEKNQESRKKVSPMVPTTTLANKIGDIEYAKVLNYEKCLVRCADAVQMEKALKVKEIGKCKMENTGRVGARMGGGSTGVITGVRINVSMEELKRNIKGGKVLKVQRLKYAKEGVMRDSETVSVEFEGDQSSKEGILGIYELSSKDVCTKPNAML